MPSIETDEPVQNFSDLSRSLSEASQSSVALGKALSQAFDGLAFKGKSLSDTFASLALSLSQSALKAAFAPLQSDLSGLFSGMVSGLLKSGATMPFAKGGLLQAGTPVPFASGGTIAAPVSFPLSNGRTAVAGERGAEAILPLARGPDGRLGVAAATGATAANITINISASDVESFRRSETQLAAILTRAVALGHRNL